MSSMRLAARFVPDLDMNDAMARMDALCDGAEVIVGLDGSEEERLGRLLRFLFHDQGFRGDRQNFRDPQNSYLHCVLERRLGIPLSLTVLMIAVAERVDVSLRPVSFPAHFLARYDQPGGRPVMIDAFNGGALLDEAGCRRLLEQRTGGRVPFDPRFLRPASLRSIELRTLRNLKAGHLEKGDVEKVLVAIDGILELRGDLMDEVRDRGLLSIKVGELLRAQTYLQRYVDTCPTAGDVAAIRIQLDSVRRQLT